MGSAKINCPQCKAGFTLKAPDLSAMAHKLFRCPKCGFSINFGQLLGPVMGPGHALHTHIANGSSNQTLKTKIATGRGNVNLLIESTGVKLPLSVGTYTLGRASSDSTATVRVAPDPYMSRLHARIDVVNTMHGISCKILPLNDINPVYINKKIIKYGTESNLKNGDKILMGITTLKVQM